LLTIDDGLAAAAATDAAGGMPGSAGREGEPAAKSTVMARAPSLRPPRACRATQTARTARLLLQLRHIPLL
jgi:hypothetical protein